MLGIYWSFLFLGTNSLEAEVFCCSSPTLWGFFCTGWARWMAWWLRFPLLPTSIRSPLSLQCGQQWSGVEILSQSCCLSQAMLPRKILQSMGSNCNARLLRWEMSSLKLHRILKPVLAKRWVRSKNQYWTMLKCLCSAAVLSGLYRPFKSCCQQMEEIQLLKSQRIINSVLDLQLCRVYKKSIICHMLLPYA